MFRKGWPRHIQEAQPSAITYVRCAVSISCWLIQRQEHQLQVEWERSRIDSVDDVYTELSVAAAVANVYESDSWPGYDNYEDQSQEDNNTKWIVMLYMVRHPLSLCLLLSSSCVLPFYLNWIYWLTQFQRYNWFNGFFIQMIRAACQVRRGWIKFSHYVSLCATDFETSANVISFKWTNATWLLFNMGEWIDKSIRSTESLYHFYWSNQ